MIIFSYSKHRIVENKILHILILKNHTNSIIIKKIAKTTQKNGFWRGFLLLF